MKDAPENNLEDKPVNRDLYFLPILARAFQRPDRVEALKRAFAGIDELGREDAYRHGYAQFQQFMAEAVIRQVPDVLVEKGGQIIARIDPSHAAGESIVPQITPGRYAVRLSTGRLLWTDELDAADLPRSHVDLYRGVLCRSDSKSRTLDDQLQRVVAQYGRWLPDSR